MCVCVCVHCLWFRAVTIILATTQCHEVYGLFFECYYACICVCVCLGESLLGELPLLLQLIVIDLHPHLSTTCRLRQTHMDEHTHTQTLFFPLPRLDRLQGRP